MNIALLYFVPPKDTNMITVDSRWERAAKDRGHSLIRLFETDLSFTYKDGQLVILNNNQPLPDIDVIIARPNYIEEPSLHTYVTELLDRAGYIVINKRPSFSISKNKLAQRVRLSEHNIPMPAWTIVRNPANALACAEQIGFPLIAKVAFGSHGKGVFFCESKEAFLPLAEYLAIRDGNPLILEAFVKDAERKDVRAYVLDGKVIACMERTAKPGDVRANVSAGGSAEPTTLSAEEEAMVIKAAEVFELEIAGVDFVRSSDGPLVLEVNGNPGLKIEDITGVDVAGAILDYAKEVKEKTDATRRKET